MILRVAKSAISCQLGEVYVATDSKKKFLIFAKKIVSTLSLQK